MSTSPSRKISLINNSIFSVLSWFLPILIGFFVTPLIVRNLGNREYGLYAVILGFISYSFSFGVGKILTKYIAEYRAAGETERIGEVVSATFWLSIGLALIGSVVVALSSHYIAANLLALPPDMVDKGEIGLYLACGAIIATIPSQIAQFILQGLHRFGSFVVLTNISGLVLNIGNVALAIMGYGTVTLLTWNLIALCAMGAAFVVDAWRHLPEFSLRLNLRSREWPRVLRYGSNIILYQVFGNVLLAFERGWVIRKFGAEAATIYVIPMTLAIYMNSIIASCMLAVFPVFNELLFDREKLNELYTKATKLLIAVVFLFSTLLIFGGHALLHVWINEDMAARGYPILVIHVLTFALIAVMMMVWQMAESYRAPMFNTLTSLAWMAVAIPLMILLSDRFNIEGVAAARLAGVAVTMPFILLLEKRLMGRSFWRSWTAVAARSAAASAAAAASMFFYFAYVPTNVLTVLAGLSLGTAVFMSVLFITGFFTPDERELLGILLKKFGKYAAD